MSDKKSKIIIGIDPGTIVTGYGILRTHDRELETLDYGCIRPPPKLKLADRYLIIFNSLGFLFDRYPDEDMVVVVETQYVKNNIQSAIKLGMARGVVIIAAKTRNIPIFEYTPTQAKLAAVGRGHASKYQVQGMVQMLLKLSTKPEPEDAADALALAICHSHAEKNFKNTKQL
jgi:crossover junction endodeoxyribonuclease RuvC